MKEEKFIKAHAEALRAMMQFMQAKKSTLPLFTVYATEGGHVLVLPFDAIPNPDRVKEICAAIIDPNTKRFESALIPNTDN